MNPLSFSWFKDELWFIKSSDGFDEGRVSAIILLLKSVSILDLFDCLNTLFPPEY